MIGDRLKDIRRVLSQQNWMVWASLPFLEGLALHFAGSTAGSKRWKTTGSITLGAGIVLYLLVFLLPERNYLPGRYVGYLAAHLTFLMGMLILPALLRQEWLEGRVRSWRRDTRQQPNPADRPGPRRRLEF